MMNSQLRSIVTLISWFTRSVTLSAGDGRPALQADLRTNRVTVSWVSSADAFIPKLRTGGLDQDGIRMITEETPIRAFAFLTRRPDTPLVLVNPQ